MMLRFLFIFLMVPFATYAASTDYQVELFVGSDTTPPTVPVIVSTIPVAPSQIDVTWSASTDSVAVSGYRVYRDGLQIATTSLTSYADTGLLPETTYSYTVDAFDIFNNISSSSLAMATTTLAMPVVVPTSTPTTTVSDEGSVVVTAGARLAGNVSVEASSRSAVIKWDTISPSRYVIRWGRTEGYEIGMVSGAVFNRVHQTQLDQLEPGTTYFYEIIGVSPFGFERVIATDSFTTSPLFVRETIENVQHATLRVEGVSALLGWKNPALADFDYVRVVRNHLFYPQHPQDGVVVYQGDAEGWYDESALAEHSPQYYTIFVYDSAGNVSSGAVLRADRLTVSDNLDTGYVPEGDTSYPSFPDVVILPDVGDNEVLSAEEVFIEQNGVMVNFAQLPVIDSNSQFVVFVPYGAVPKHIKSIIVTIPDVTHSGTVIRYLLKLNTTGERYQAAIPAVGRVGEVRVSIEVFDYELGTIRRISTPVTFIDGSLQVLWPDEIVASKKFIGIAMSGVGVSALLWWLWLLWRRREDNN